MSHGRIWAMDVNPILLLEFDIFWTVKDRFVLAL